MTGRIGTFWSDAEQAPLIVFTDFDFTISQVDVGDLVTDTLAPPSPETLRRFANKEIGTRLYWLDSIVRADIARAERLADTVAIDPHFPAFAAWCKANGIPLAIVSDGFWFYIRRILRREGLEHLPVFCNEMNSPGAPVFPHANPACDFCGCCKAGVVRRAREMGARLVYVGDGVSDMYGSALADWVFAKARLARHLSENGVPFFPFESFADVHRTLASDLDAFRRGTAPGRSEMTPDPRCRFGDQPGLELAENGR